MANKKKIDEMAKARDFFGLDTREGARIQNQINSELGSKKRRDWSNMPTANQMKIAKSGKDTAVAGMRATKATKAAEGLSTGDTITKALAGLKAPKEDKKPKKGNKTRSDLNKMLGGM